MVNNGFFSTPLVGRAYLIHRKLIVSWRLGSVRGQEDDGIICRVSAVAVPRLVWLVCCGRPALRGMSWL